jgi:predicted Zn-dependent protease
MSDYIDLCEAVLAAVPGHVEAQASVRVTRKALTRFANSYIHQNVEEDTAVLTVDLADQGRIARASTTLMDGDSLDRLVATALDAVATSPVDEDWTGFSDPVDVPEVGHYDAPTASAGPEARAAVVADFIDAGSDMSAAGYCDTTTEIRAVANHLGLRYEGSATSAVLDGIQQTDSSAGKAHRESQRLGELDGAAVGREAAAIAAAAVDAVDLVPGPHEVVLRPNCAATIAIFVGLYGFGGKAASEQRTKVVLDELQFDPKITMRDDVTDPRALGLPVDWEGNPKRVVELIREGRSQGFVHDRRTAGRMGVESTGHDWEHSAWFGPAPTNLFIAGGDGSEEEMIGSIDRGLLVTEFNYCRILDPTTLVVTGLTRNGTFLIEEGRVTRPVSNLRFTESFFDALRDGNVVGLAGDARLADSEYGPGMVHAPTMHLASWNFTGGAKG